MSAAGVGIIRRKSKMAAQKGGGVGTNPRKMDIAKTLPASPPSPDAAPKNPEIKQRETVDDSRKTKHEMNKESRPKPKDYPAR